MVWKVDEKNDEPKEVEKKTTLNVHGDVMFHGTVSSRSGSTSSIDITQPSPGSGVQTEIESSPPSTLTDNNVIEEMSQ